MTDNASFFKGIGDAAASRDRDYFKAGCYLTHVDGFKIRQNEDQLVYFIFELTVLDVLDDSEALKTPDKANGIGHKVSIVLPKHKKPTLPNLKQILMVMTGVPEEDVTPEFCGALCSEAQPLKHTAVEFLNRQIKTKSGAPFTQVRAKRRWTKDEVIAKIGQARLNSLKLEIED